MNLLPEPSSTLAWGLGSLQRCRPETQGGLWSVLREWSSVLQNRLRTSPPGTGGADFYSEHIHLCLGKGKHEIHFVAMLKSMEGKLISKEESQRHNTVGSGFTSAEQTLISPPGRIPERAGS